MMKIAVQDIRCAVVAFPRASNFTGLSQLPHCDWQWYPSVGILLLYSSSLLSRLPELILFCFPMLYGAGIVSNPVIACAKMMCDLALLVRAKWMSASLAWVLGESLMPRS